MNQKTEDELAHEHLLKREEEIVYGGMNSVEPYLKNIWIEIEKIKEKIEKIEKNIGEK